MKVMKKIFSSVLLTIVAVLILNSTYAASANISASKTTATVGDNVKVTVTVKAAAWNLLVSGSATGDIIGVNMEGVNQTTTKTYTVSCKNAGTYTVKLAGDITDQDSDAATLINKTVTITVKEKVVAPSDNSQNTTTTKSSNCNLTKISLNVEGLSFKSSQTTYNIKVGADIDNITVKATPAHSKARYTVSGNKNLKAGNNVIKIVVKAENGATKTYKINVEKAGDIEDTSADLSNLIIENMTFTNAFTSNETEYVGNAIKYTETLNVLPYTVSEKATFEIIGNDDLKIGNNTIIVKVTSYDETNTKEYKVTFDMLAKEEEDALQVVSPNVDLNLPKEEVTWKEIVKKNSTIILLYILALVEFAQVVYLYIQLKNINADTVTIKRRNKK